MGPPRISSVRNLLEKVGDLRGIVILVPSNLTFLILVGPVFPKSSAFMVTELHSILRKTNHKSTTNRELELFSNFFLIAWVCSDE